MSKHLKNNASMVIKMMKQELNVDLAFNQESVQWLDGYIERNRRYLRNENIDNLVNVFGAFLGEAMIQSYGGTWGLDSDKNVWYVRFENDRKAFPINRVADQFKNGAEDSILSFFNRVQFSHDGQQSH